MKFYQTVALKRFVLKLPGSAQELTAALKHKKAKQQGLTFIFFARLGSCQR